MNSDTRPRIDIPAESATSAVVIVGPGLRALALLIIPIGIIAYYVVFSYTLYMVGLVALALLGVIFAPGAGIPWRETLPLVFTYAWWWLTVLWTPNPEAAFYVMVTAVYVMFAFIAAPLKVRFGEDFPLRLSMFCGLAFALCSLISFSQIGTFIDEEKGSVRTIFSAFFLAGTPASVYFALRSKSLAAAAILALMLGIGIQLQSRTFILVVIPAILLTAMVMLRTSRVVQMLRLPLTVIVSAAGLLVVSFAVQSAGGEFFDVLGRQTSFAVDEGTFWEARNPALAAADLERRLLVVVGLDSFAQNPIIGAGFLSTPFYMGQYYRAELTAHGFPLFLLGETGLIGTLLFAWLLFLSLQGFLRSARQLAGDNATLAYVELITLGVILAVGLFHQVYSDFYFYLFLGVGLWRRAVFRRALSGGLEEREPHIHKG